MESCRSMADPWEDLARTLEGLDDGRGLVVHVRPAVDVAGDDGHPGGVHSFGNLDRLGDLLQECIPLGRVA